MALAHNVYFSLHDHSEGARARLIQACRTHLTAHPGILFFACGELVADLRREVNDTDFDVALHVVFLNRAAHDAYQEAPAHLRFIAENKAGWGKVRVFDSVVEQTPATTS
jgi:hypothetical protein